MCALYWIGSIFFLPILVSIAIIAQLATLSVVVSRLRETRDKLLEIHHGSFTTAVPIT